jgi:Domain of unknown function (DUF1932)
MAAASSRLSVKRRRVRARNVRAPGTADFSRAETSDRPAAGEEIRSHDAALRALGGRRIDDNVPMTVALLSPGEMGAAVGAALRARDETVVWASVGRSAATAERAREAGLEDVRTIEDLCRLSDVIISLCPPHAAVEVAGLLRGFAGVFVDANAVSPTTARAIAGLVGRYVDGGIIGPPPRVHGTTRLYLSGREAKLVADLFTGTTLDARVVSDEPDAASAVKMAFAAWTKGSSALLLAARALARAEGVEDTLLQEWRSSLPDLHDQSVAAARAAVSKGWRWIAEMEEVAQSFAAAGLPDGFHKAAAEIYRHSPREVAGDDSLERVLAQLATKAPS